MTTGREQIALLTCGYRLPIEPLTRTQLGIIVQAITESWRRSVAGTRDNRAREPEVTLNAGLVIHLQRLIDGEGQLLRSLVSHVSRGAELHNFNGLAPEKRPDINLYLTDRRSPLPFCGECKIVDETTRKGARLYNKKGVRRFIDGDYNWLFSQGFMVAYVRDAVQAEVALAESTGCVPTPWIWKDERHFQTVHDRAFTYVDRDPVETVPGPITLLHVRLDGVPRGMHRPRRPGCPKRRDRTRR